MKKILIVDDESEVRDVLSVFLERKGFETRKCEDGEAALAVLGEDKAFDLVILDNRMPGMKGTELISRMRDEGLVIPVILLTGSVGSEEQAAGADMLIRKPVDLCELVASMNSILKP